MRASCHALIPASYASCSALLPGAGASIRYADLMGGVKPNLLAGYKNNLGAEARIAYTPSTRFFLDDRAAGRPWATRLPFPVHVVSRVETFGLGEGVDWQGHDVEADGETTRFRVRRRGSYRGVATEMVDVGVGIQHKVEVGRVESQLAEGGKDHLVRR